MTAWPKDNQAARNAFYGDPGANEIAAQMVPVVPPFAMFYEGRRVKAIQFHKKAAPALQAALDEIWEACGRDQKKIDACGVSKYAGAYNRRMVRGSKTKWSNHAYAAAIDLNAEENGLYAKGNMPQFVIDAFCRQGAMWGGWYTGRKDPMHFEFVDNGGRKPKFAAPGAVGKPLRLIDDPEDDAPADDLDDAPIDPGPPPHVVNVQPPTAPYKTQVETIQRALDALGYHEVGEIDGRWGGKTKGALTAFLNDRGSEIKVNGGVTPAIEDAISEAREEGWTRPISTARANATAQDIAPKVEAVKQTLWQRLGAKVTGAFGIGAAAVSGASDSFGVINDKVLPVKEYFAATPGWVWFALIAAGALIVYLSATRAQNSTVAAYNTGKIN